MIGLGFFGRMASPRRMVDLQVRRRRDGSADGERVCRMDRLETIRRKGQESAEQNALPVPAPWFSISMFPILYLGISTRLVLLNCWSCQSRLARVGLAYFEMFPFERASQKLKEVEPKVMHPSYFIPTSIVIQPALPLVLVATTRLRSRPCLNFRWVPRPSGRIA